MQFIFGWKYRSVLCCSKCFIGKESLKIADFEREREKNLNYPLKGDLGQSMDNWTFKIKSIRFCRLFCLFLLREESTLLFFYFMTPLKSNFRQQKTPNYQKVSAAFCESSQWGFYIGYTGQNFENIFSKLASPGGNTSRRPSGIRLEHLHPQGQFARVYGRTF